MRDLVSGIVTTLDTHRFYESRPNNHGDAGGAIECSRPCLVVQYVVGQLHGSSDVDCAMRLVPSVDAYVK